MDRPPTPEFLGWLADRLVHVYGESENVDFVQRLRREALRVNLSESVLSDSLAEAMGGWYGDSKPFHDHIAKMQFRAISRRTDG